MTTYFETVPLTGDQMDVEQGYGGQPVFVQQPGVAVANDNVDLGVMHKKGKHAFILSIVSFILCGLAAVGSSMICHIAAMLFAAKSRVSVEKKDYFDSKLMLHWSYICTFAGCFIGGIPFFIIILCLVVQYVVALAVATTSANQYRNY